MGHPPAQRPPSRAWLLLGDAYFLAFVLASRHLPGFASLRIAERLGRLAGSLECSIRPARRRRLEQLLARSFSEAPSLARRIFQTRWTDAEPHVLEALTRSEAALEHARAAVRIDGLPRLHDAAARGRGIVLWGSPFGKPFLGEAVLRHQGFEISHVHDPGPGQDLPRWIRRTGLPGAQRRARERLVSELIEIPSSSLGYLRSLAERLRAGGIVSLNACGRGGHAFVEAELLGSRRRFATGSISLARMQEAPIVPIFCFTDRDGADRLVVEEPIPIPRAGDRHEVAEQIVRRYVSLLEARVREFPAQFQGWSALLAALDEVP